MRRTRGGNPADSTVGPAHRAATCRYPQELLLRGGLGELAVASALSASESAGEKHMYSILRKLRLPQSESDHRRVVAVLSYLAAS
jgi:hypothetical protein